MRQAGVWPGGIIYLAIYFVLLFSQVLSDRVLERKWRDRGSSLEEVVQAVSSCSEKVHYLPLVLPYISQFFDSSAAYQHT